MIYFSEYSSPAGILCMESSGSELTALYFKENAQIKSSKSLILKDDLSLFMLIREWLDRYFAGENPPIEGLPLNLEGSDFRKLVWKYLLEIPYGEVVTYGELAKRVAKDLNKEKMSSRAIGNAVKNNPIAIIIPCHRVVSKAGIGGYNAGVERKILLLRLEKIAKNNFNKIF